MGLRKGQPWSLRPVLVELLPLAQIIAFVFVSWKALSVALDTPFPIMVVTSESMEPAFQVGDLLVVTNHHERVRVGDLPVCWLPERHYPMIHRVIQTSWDLDKRQLLLTKGDNNVLDDSLLYPEGQDYIARNEVAGFVWFYVSMVGWPLILAQNPRRWQDLVSRLSSSAEIDDMNNVYERTHIDL